MREALLGILVLLVMAAPMFGMDLTNIDGVIEEGEWTDYWVYQYVDDYPHYDNGQHVLVDVYLAQDADFYYAAFITNPATDGFEKACWDPDPLDPEIDPERWRLEAVHSFYACGDPDALPENEDCNDPYGFCAKEHTELHISMGSTPPFASWNTGICDDQGNPTPESIDGDKAGRKGITTAYFGYKHGCNADPPDYAFFTELAIPRHLLNNARYIMIGGSPWTDDSFMAYEERDDGSLCSCMEGTQLAIPVEVDIKPNNDRNCLNLGSESRIKVAILGTEEFDPTDRKTGVSCRTVEFLGVLADRCRTVDINDDGRTDVIALYRGRSLLRKGQFDCDATTAEVTGRTFTGTSFSGEDAICYLGPEPCP